MYAYIIIYTRANSDCVEGGKRVIIISQLLQNQVVVN